MGKPIARQNQFPYGVKGFLVDGAKINGVTYAKVLYIYKQRSDEVYDLMDNAGNIFQFIKIGHKDISGNKLNYFEPAESLVELIPDNTFFMKIQDATRNIFSFVRLYQWHKCITFEGDYIFRKKSFDPWLSGVLINPPVSTVSIGEKEGFVADFFPPTYNDRNGQWHINRVMDDGSVVPINTRALVTESIENKLSLIPLSEGTLLLTFIPEKNESLISNAIVYVKEKEKEFTKFKLDIVKKYDSWNFESNEEYQIVVSTFPDDHTFTEPLDVSTRFTNTNYGNSKTELVRVSDDFKTYTFKTYRDPSISDRYLDPYFTFKMTSPFEYSASNGYVSIVEKVSKPTEPIRSYSYHFMPTNTSAPLIWSKISDDFTLLEIISNNPEVATFDKNTNLITTKKLNDYASFSQKFKDKNDVIKTTDLVSFVINDDDTYTGLTQNMDILYIRDVGTYNINALYHKHEQTIPVKLKSSSNQYYTLSSDGVLVVKSLPPSYYQITIEAESRPYEPIFNTPADLLPITLLNKNYNEELVRIETNQVYIHEFITTQYMEDPGPGNTASGLLAFYGDYNGRVFDEELGIRFEIEDPTMAYMVTTVEEMERDLIKSGFASFYFVATKRGRTKITFYSTKHPEISGRIVMVAY